MPVSKVKYRDYHGKWQTSSPEGILAQAAVDPWFPYPYAMLHAIIKPVLRPTEGYSITTLEQECVRCVVLQAREPYELNLERNWKRFRGTGQHFVMEQHAHPDVVVEPRFYADMDGRVIHGAIDVFWPHEESQEFTIQDYKFPDKAPRWDNVWHDHKVQVNGYRWLVNHADHFEFEVGGDQYDNIYKEWNARSLGIIYVDQEGPKPLEVRKKVQVPTKPGAKNTTKTVKVPDIWTDEEVEAEFIPRIWALEAAFEQYDKDGTLPDYPVGMDPFTATGLHAYSDTVDVCLHRWKENR